MKKYLIMALAMLGLATIQRENSSEKVGDL